MKAESKLYNVDEQLTTGKSIVLHFSLVALLGFTIAMAVVSINSVW